MTRRRKLSPLGNGPIALTIWWAWNAVWFSACVLATIFLSWLLAATLYFALVLGVGAP